MSEQERKQEQKPSTKLEIKKGSGELDDKDVEKVTGGTQQACQQIWQSHMQGYVTK